MMKFSALLTCLFFFSIGASPRESSSAVLNPFLKRLSPGKTCRLHLNGRPISEIEWEEGITLESTIVDATEPYTILLNTTCQYVKRIHDIQTFDQRNYADGLLLRNQGNQGLNFVVRLIEAFELYEEYEDSITLKINVVFLCDNGDFKSLEIRQRIYDTNNHSPAFVTNNVFYLPTVIPANTFISKILARDVDLTNDEITFAFKPENSNIKEGFGLFGSYRDSKDTKLFHAWLITTETVHLTEDLIFTVTAKDSGIPSRNSSAVIELRRQPTTTSIPSSSTALPSTTIPSRSISTRAQKRQ